MIMHVDDLANLSCRRSSQYSSKTQNKKRNWLVLAAAFHLHNAPFVDDRNGASQGDRPLPPYHGDGRCTPTAYHRFLGRQDIYPGQHFH